MVRKRLVVCGRMGIGVLWSLLSATKFSHKTPIFQYPIMQHSPLAGEDMQAQH